MQTTSKLLMLRKATAQLRADGSSIALVQTMGGLHEGHLTLMRKARAKADHVVASIFVNPRQFGAGEDLDNYPRQLERDAAMLKAEGVRLLWAPDPQEMYPAGYTTNISVPELSSGLCAGSRPTHFDGVATVVCKLFNQVQPDMAFFGEKDWQQLAVIRRMAGDLDLTLPHKDAIYGVATVREADGLAMSSRNSYLSEEERAIASALPQETRSAIDSILSGESVKVALDHFAKALLERGFESVDYAELRDGESLEVLDKAAKNARLFVAAKLGPARLIDNVPLY